MGSSVPYKNQIISFFIAVIHLTYAEEYIFAYVIEYIAAIMILKKKSVSSIKNKKIFLFYLHLFIHGHFSFM